MRLARKPKSYADLARKYAPDFHKYEAEKAAWVASHPKATPDQYTRAMREIATRCGI